MEKTKENDIPNLIDSEGNALVDIESKKRAEILGDIKEKRKQRDTLLKQSSSFKTKINDFLGKGEGVSLRSRAEAVQKDLYKDIDWKHTLLDRELKQEAKSILEKTVGNPLTAISTFYKQKENKKKRGEGEDIDFKLEEQKILESFKCENITKAFQDKELRKSITYDLRNFFDSEHNWQVYQQIEHFDTYSNKEAKGLPVDVAKAVLEGINQAIEKDGVLKIEDDPNLFLLLNEIIYIYPDGMTDKIRDNIASLMVERGIGLPMHTLARLSRLTGLVELTNHEESFNLQIDKKLSDLFNQKKWFDIDFACKSFGESLSRVAMHKLDEYLKQYRVTLEDIQQAWGLYPGVGQSGFRNLETNMEKIEHLEIERPGITKVLISDFHIKEFRRYPNEVLIEQFDQRKINIPYGVVLYSNEDHNQAFDMDTKVLRSLFEQSKENNIGLRVMEFDSKYELIRNMAQLNARYGGENKISYLLLGAHGQEESFQTTFSEEVHKNDFDGKGVQRVKDFFVANPEIILASCSTGVPNGIAQKISEMYDAKVYAPDKPTSVNRITMKIKGTAPTFSVQYQDNVLQSYTHGVKDL
jgi:hypothetical protein